jgi:spore coat protein CotH
MTQAKDESAINRREFIIKMGGGMMGLGLFMLFPVLGTSCKSLIVEGEEQEDGSLFSSDRVVKVYIVMNQSDWKSLISNSFDEKYRQADLWYGSTVVYDIAVRAKGNYKTVAEVYPDSIRCSLKADLNLLNAEQNLDGVKKLNFNNNWGDPSFIREVLGYELFRQMDVPAPRAAFIDLWVNEIHLGLYTMVEQVDKIFIQNNFSYTNGNLYKPEKPAGNLAWTKADLEGDETGSSGDINIGGGSLDDIINVVNGNDSSNTDSDAADASLIEQMGLKTNENKSDHSLLFSLLDILNNEPDDTFPIKIGQVLDVDEVLRFLAVSSVLVHLDNYIGSGENYYLYDNNGKFVIIPWDLNLSFGTYRIDLAMEQVIDFYIDEPTCGAISAKPLVNRLLSNSTYLEKYHSYIQNLLDGGFDVDTMNARIDELVGIIHSYVEDDDTRFYSMSQFEKGISGQSVSDAVISGNEGIPIGLKYFIEQRSRSVRAQLAGTLASSSGTGAGNGKGESAASGGSAGIGGAVIVLGSVIKVTGSGVSIIGNRINITKGGNYEISGTLEDGQIIVDADDSDVNLILNGVNIKSSSGAPVYILDAEKTTVTLAEGTSNYITDGSSYINEDAEAGEPDAAIFSKDDLVIDGNGSLQVSANYRNGIAGKDALTISGGHIIVNAVNDGIRGRDSITVAGGVIEIIAGSDGMQSNNDQDAALGYIAIEGGILNITAAGDGIAAETNVSISGGELTISTGGGSANGSYKGGGNDMFGGMDWRTTTTTGSMGSAKGIKAVNNISITGGNINIDSADDGLHSDNSFTVGGGNITIASGDDGIHAESRLVVNDGAINIVKSYEGMESPDITVNGGSISIVSSDDGINGVSTSAGSMFGGMGGMMWETGAYFYINGGYIYINAAGDGIDIGGSIEMTAGTVIINGPTSSANGALDFTGFSMKGGTIIAAGSSGMAQSLSTTSVQYSVAITYSGSQSADTLVHIESASGEDILTFAPAKTYQSVIFSSPALKKGETYTVYSGGSSTGTVADGLYLNGIYSGGSKYTTFTVSSIVTTVGSGGGGMIPGRR